MSGRILLVDLNNFARYPSVAIGYLTAILRAGGYEVELLAPLSTGVGGVPREPKAPWWGRLDLEFRYRTAVSRNRLLRRVRAQYATYRASKLARSKHSLCEEFSRRLDAGFDAVLISTYLMYYPHCVALGEICRDRGIPMLLGGPYFAAAEVAREWMGVPGLAALVGGEVEPHLCELVRRVIMRESTVGLPGVWSNDANGIGLYAPPLDDLDSLPFPDYSQFPWAKYPNTIVPMITGRGCGWGVCTFCSDVTSTAGRTFRSRSPENVLAELSYQRARHNARLFVFTDLKLNSHLNVWRALASNFQREVPGARWIGAVHVGSRGENGLTRDELEARASRRDGTPYDGLRIGQPAAAESHGQRCGSGLDESVSCRCSPSWHQRAHDDDYGIPWRASSRCGRNRLFPATSPGVHRANSDLPVSDHDRNTFCAATGSQSGQIQGFELNYAEPPIRAGRTLLCGDGRSCLSFCRFAAAWRRAQDQSQAAALGSSRLRGRDVAFRLRHPERRAKPAATLVVDAATTAGAAIGFLVGVGIREVDAAVLLAAPVVVMHISAVAGRLRTAAQRQHRCRRREVALAIPLACFGAGLRPRLNADGVIGVCDPAVLHRSTGCPHLGVDPSTQEPVG